MSWNEISRRYVDEEPEFWFPKVWRSRADNVKQGSSNTPVDISLVSEACYMPENIIQHTIDLYNKMLEINIAPELARIILPQNMMTTWIWSGSLMAMVRVIKQRTDPHAQQESQEVALLMKEQVEKLFPASFAALTMPLEAP